MHPTLKLWIGILLAMPFLIMNAIVAERLEPLYSFLGSIGIIAASPLPTVPILIILGLLGGCIAISPLFQKDIRGKRNSYLMNALVGFALIAFFGFVGVVLGEEIYRCNVLGVPNCD